MEIKWINAKTDPPEEDGFYNVVCDTDDGEITHSLWYQDETWRFDNHCIEGEPTHSTSWWIDITHWAPIPYPPN